MSDQDPATLFEVALYQEVCGWEWISLYEFVREMRQRGVTS